jgi:hypothetical protein
VEEVTETRLANKDERLAKVIPSFGKSIGMFGSASSHRLSYKALIMVDVMYHECLTC